MSVIARDRATVCIRPIRNGAPQATQAPDRRHLLHNFGDALRAAVGRHRGAVSAAGIIGRRKAEQLGLHRAPVCYPGVVELRNERRQVRAERYAAIGGLQAEGMAARQIARELGMSQRAVERWLTARGEPKHRRSPVLSDFDPFRPYLDRRQ